MNMVEAVITWKTGETVTVHAREFPDLFAALGDKGIQTLEAYEIDVTDIRQGRCANLDAAEH